MKKTVLVVIVAALLIGAGSVVGEVSTDPDLDTTENEGEDDDTETEDGEATAADSGDETTNDAEATADEDDDGDNGDEAELEGGETDTPDEGDTTEEGDAETPDEADTPADETAGTTDVDEDDTSGEGVETDTQDTATDSGANTADTAPDDDEAIDEGEPSTADTEAVASALAVVELNVDAVPAEENIVLENTGETALDLGQWTVRDREGGQIDRGLAPFQFPTEFTLGPGEQVRIWTGEGENTASDLYWGYNTNIWNQEGDVIILESPAGERVFEHPYGDVESNGDPVDPEAPSEGDEPPHEPDAEPTVPDDRPTEPDEEVPREDTPDDTHDGDLEIHHLDVGQADATLVVTPAGETILIDTGDWRQDGADVIAYLDEHDIDRIDHLVATHAHADHIGGHAAVIEHVETTGEGIGAAYDSGVAHGTATYEHYLDAIEAYEVDLFEVEEGDELPLEDDTVEALVLNPPANESESDLHYNSIALSITVDEFTYLTTGDAEADAEQRLVADWATALNATVYQAGHHGSSTSSTQPFMNTVDPEIAIISSDETSQYGHPHGEVLERFTAMDVDTYWTGVHGDVVVRTDGTTVDVETTQEFSTDAAAIHEAAPDDDGAESIAPSGGGGVTAPLVG